MGSGTEVLAVVISEPWLPPLYHRVRCCAGGRGEKPSSEPVTWVGIPMGRTNLCRAGPWVREVELDSVLSTPVSHAFR